MWWPVIIQTVCWLEGDPLPSSSSQGSPPHHYSELFCHGGRASPSLEPAFPPSLSLCLWTVWALWLRVQSLSTHPHTRALTTPIITCNKTVITLKTYTFWDAQTNLSTPVCMCFLIQFLIILLEWMSYIVLYFVSVSFVPGPLRVFKASSWSCHLPVSASAVLIIYGMHVWKTFGNNLF